MGGTLRTVKGIKVDSGTIASYLTCFSECFLFRQAKRYDVKGKKYFSYPSKYYCSDIGLRNVRLNLRQQEETHIMENIMFNELVCRGYSVDVGVVDIFETDAKGKKEGASAVAWSQGFLPQDHCHEERNEAVAG